MIYKEYVSVQSLFTHVSSIYANLQELQKNAPAWEKKSTRRGLLWNTNMAAVSLFWNTNMVVVKSCENAIQRDICIGIYIGESKTNYSRGILVLQRNSEMNQSMEKWIRKSCSLISLHSKYPWVSYGNIRGKHLLIDCFIHFTTSQTSWTLTW